MLGVLEQVRLEHVVRDTVSGTSRSPTVLDAAEVSRTNDDDDACSEQRPHWIDMPIPRSSVFGFRPTVELTCGWENEDGCGAVHRKALMVTMRVVACIS